MSARRVLGVLLLLSLTAVVFADLYFARLAWREKVGLNEAEPNLDRFARAAASAYATRGHLCASSHVSSRDPMSMWAANGWSKHTQRELAEEVRGDTGFGCLGVDLRTLVSGRDGYVYQSSGDAFVVQAFRVYLFDPSGVLPRFERRGRVVDGHVEIDPQLYQVKPGGPEFPGHPRDGGSFWEGDS